MKINEVSTGNNEWYTPGKYVESARKVMGSISLDPASCEFAQKIIKADNYYCAISNGLNHSWTGNIWLNPPYARLLIDDFIIKLISSNIDQAVVLVNSSTDTKWFNMLLKHANSFVMTNHRISFINANGIKKKDNARGQTFFYFGANTFGFNKEFSQYGYVINLR